MSTYAQENITYWTRRAPSYSDVNQEELGGGPTPRHCAPRGGRGGANGPPRGGGGPPPPPAGGGGGGGGGGGKNRGGGG